MLEKLFEHFESQAMKNKVLENYYSKSRLSFETEALKVIFKKNLTELRDYFNENKDYTFKVEMHVNNNTKIIILNLNKGIAEDPLIMIKKNNIVYCNNKGSTYLNISGYDIACEDSNYLSFENFELRTMRKPHQSGELFFDKEFQITNEDYVNINHKIYRPSIAINTDNNNLNISHMDHDLIFFDNHYEVNFKNKKGSKMYNEKFNVILDESRNPINIKYKADDFIFEGTVTENTSEKFEEAKEMYLISTDKKINIESRHILNVVKSSYDLIFDYYDSNKENINRIRTFIIENNQMLLNINNFLRAYYLVDFKFVNNTLGEEKKYSIDVFFTHMENKININKISGLELQYSLEKQEKLKLHEKIEKDMEEKSKKKYTL